MKLKPPKRDEASSSNAKDNGSRSGSGLLQNGMDGYRFSAGEVRVVQIGYISIVFSCVLFTLLSFTTLIPALNSRKLRSTECLVVSSEIVDVATTSGRMARCSHSHSICLRITVVYQTNVTEKEWEDARRIGEAKGSVKYRKRKQEKKIKHSMHVMTAVLRYDELQLPRKKEPICTILPKCSDHEEENVWAIKRLQHSLGQVGSRTRCFYNPENFAEVIATKFFDENAINNCLIWPGLFLVIGVYLVVTVKYCIGFFKPKIGERKKVTAEEEVKSMQESFRRSRNFSSRKMK